MAGARRTGMTLLLLLLAAGTAIPNTCAFLLPVRVGVCTHTAFNPLRSCRTQLRGGLMMSAEPGAPIRVVAGEFDSAQGNVWCDPSFKLDEGGPECMRYDLGDIDGAFLLRGVLSPEEAARMVATAERMGFERAKADDADDADEGGANRSERQNGALSWVLHPELAEELICRIAPCVPWAVHVHAPGTAAPDPSSLPALEGAVPSALPWVREVSGAPEGLYTLEGLSARCRVYKYDAGSPDAFLPHFDDAWPGSRLRLPAPGHPDRAEPELVWDEWSYAAGAEGAWAWAAGDRVSHLTVLLYLNEAFEGGHTLLHPGPHPPGLPFQTDLPSRVAVRPEVGSALCFGQSFVLGRRGVAHPPDALLHEGLPVQPLAPPAGQPKYVLRSDVSYTMPPPPGHPAPLSFEEELAQALAAAATPSSSSQPAAPSSGGGGGKASRGGGGGKGKERRRKKTKRKRRP